MLDKEITGFIKCKNYTSIVSYPYSTFDPFFMDQELLMRGFKFPTKYDPGKKDQNSTDANLPIRVLDSCHP